MKAHRDLIRKFYHSLSVRDHKEMNSCYHPDIHFTDPIFDLKGEDVRAMWHMLCERGVDLEISYGEIYADTERGSALIEAEYTFNATGRKVLNRISPRFWFQDGLIIRQIDGFSFWRWSRQAIGTPGIFLGWTPFLRKKVSRQAMKTLEEFKRKNQYM